jgi:hypothetical protein
MEAAEKQKRRDAEEKKKKKTEPQNRSSLCRKCLP